MPFILPALEQGFLDIIKNPPKSAKASAQRIAKAYADYARPATGAGAPAAFTGAEISAMANAMAGSFQEKGAPPLASNGIVSGVQAFWLAPPVVFGPSPTVLWAGAPVLLGCLASLANPKISENAAAKRLARCFDTATKLVFVQPPGPVPPVPIA